MKKKKKPVEKYYEYFFTIDNWGDEFCFFYHKRNKYDTTQLLLGDRITIYGTNRVPDHRYKSCTISVSPENYDEVYMYGKDHKCKSDRIGGFHVRKSVIDGSLSIPTQAYYSLFNRKQNFVELIIGGFRISREIPAITSFHLNEELSIDEDIEGLY